MAVNINDTALRRGIYKDPDGNKHEIEVIKVQYGSNGKEYAGLEISYYYRLYKGIHINGLIPIIYFATNSYSHIDVTLSLVHSDSNYHAISSLQLNGHIYVDTGDGIIFYDGYFNENYLLPSEIELKISRTGQERHIWKTEGYISIVTHIILEYTITYDDGIKYKDTYTNSVYDEYGVNADNSKYFRSTMTFLQSISLFEKVVWTRDPALITRPKVNIGFENVRFRETVTYVGEQYGEDIYEYYYYSDLVPNFFIKDDGTVKSDEVTGIEEISLYAFIDMRVYANGTYIIRETAFTTMTVKGTSGKFTPNLKFNGSTLSSEATRCDVRISGNATIKYKDGYSRTINLIPQYEVYYWTKSYALDRTISLTFLTGV